MTTEHAPAPRARRWPRRAHGITAALLAVAALGPIAACGDSATGTTAAVQQVVIEPGEPVVALGETVQLTATVRDAEGQPLTDRAVVWTSADPATAAVDGSGLVTPEKIGRVQIAASSEGHSTVVEVRVTARRVRTVSLAASTSRAQVGDTVSLQVTATAADGEALTDRAATITSSAPSVATVTPAGSVVAVAPGTAQIVVDVEGVSSTAQLEVVPAAAASVALSSAELSLAPGQSATLGVTVRDRRGNVLTGREASFTSSATGVATVTPDGTVRGVAPGTTTITVRVEEAQATSMVRVTAPPPAPVARIVLSPGDFALRVGESRSVTATTLDADGTVLSNRPVTWSSSNGSVASVSATGLVTARGTGTVRIEARAEGVTERVSVTVTPVPVSRVTVTPSSVELRTGETTRLTATPLDAAGAPLGGRAVSWSSSAPAIATVTEEGLVRGVAAGSATITATSESIAGSATVRVTESPPPPPGRAVRLEIVSGNEQLALQNEELPEPLVVRAVDAAGRPVPGVFIAWTTADGGRANPVLVATDESGQASTLWTLGSKSGGQAMQAVTLGVSPVTFNAVAKRR